MGLGMNIVAILVVLLCYSSLKVESKTLTDELKEDSKADTIDNELLDNIKEEVLQDLKNGEPTTELPPLPGMETGTGLRSCLRIRVLRMLLRVLLMRASGFNITQLRSGSESDSSSGSGKLPDLGLSDDDMEQICKELCDLGVCPPGCPQDNLPPWGRRR